MAEDPITAPRILTVCVGVMMFAVTACSGAPPQATMQTAIETCLKKEIPVTWRGSMMPAAATRIDKITIEQVGKFEEDYGAVRARVSGECKVQNMMFTLPPTTKSFDCVGEFQFHKNQLGEWSASINIADTGPVCAGPAAAAGAAAPAAPPAKRDRADLYALFEKADTDDRRTPERVKRFIAEGADPNYRVEHYPGDNTPNTPLRLALVHGTPVETIKALIDGGASDRSAEYLALVAPDLTKMRLLLDSGVRINDNLQNPKGWTPLMSLASDASNRGTVEVLRFMVAAGADATYRAPDGSSAYSIALQELTESENWVRGQPGGTAPGAESMLAAKRAAVDYLKSLNQEPGSSASASNAGPQIPFIDRDVCPGEGCTFGRRIADKQITVYETEGEATRKAFTIETDDGYVAESGNVWVRRAGVVKLLKALKADPIEPGGARVVIPAGEQLFVLTWLGEGMTHVWHAGKVFVVSQCWNDATTSVGASCGTLVDDGERELWVRIRNNAGQVGWSRFSM